MKFMSASDVVARQALRYGRGKQFVLGMSPVECEEMALRFGEERFRGRQLRDAVLMAGCKDIGGIVQLPKGLRQRLVEDGNVHTGRSVVQQCAHSQDDTRKMLLTLFDGSTIECVGIPTETRYTTCVSSQVGCALRCSFCATGRAGYSRNLMPHEIVDQVMWASELAQRRVSHIVFMGQGEPMLNLPSVLKAIELLQQKPFEISQRHMTLSTVGVPNTIRELAKHKLQITLAISLHNADQQEREAIIPAAKAYSLAEMMQDARFYFEETGRRISWEVCLIDGVTTGIQRANQLVEYVSQLPKSHVNLLPWNRVDESDYKAPSESLVKQFSDILTNAGIANTVRAARGSDVNAACGQLRNASSKRKDLT